MPSGGSAGSGAAPAAASRVGSQSIVIDTWSLVLPCGIRAGQETIDGIRSPPSSSSFFRPVNGQVIAKRSPPLSLVKMTMVLSVRRLSSSAFTTRPICASIASTIF